MNKLNENFEKIEKLIEDAKVDMTKFVEKGNAAAGTRVRKFMQELKALAQEVRVDIQNVKNGNE
jgi:hypothetical protein